MAVFRAGTLNHSAKASHYLREKLAESKHTMAGADDQYIQWVCDQLDNAQKFVLPKGGKFLEDTKASEYLELMRLPFHVVSLEFCIDTDTAIRRDADVEDSIQRISLCLSPSSPVLKKLKTIYPLQFLDDNQGFYVIPIFCLSSQHWVVMPFIFFVGQGSIGQVLPSKGFYTQPFEIDYMLGMQGYRLAESQQGLSAMMEMIKNDSRDEIDVAMNFALSMNCSNVEAEFVRASTSVNSKRKKKGKEIISDFHILNLKTNAPQALKSGSGNSGAKKRQHVRRGHIRRLKDKAIWINSTLIGTENPVKKIYNIK